MPSIRQHQEKNILCTTVPELVECGVSENYIKKALNQQRQGKVTCWPHHKEGNTIYIWYDGLKENYKALIKAILCRGTDPYRFASTQAIDNYLVTTPSDETQLTNYRKPDGRALTDEEQDRYRNAVRWLNLLDHFDQAPRIRKVFNLSKGEFNIMVMDPIKELGVDLPKNYSRLKNKLREYRDKGATAVIPEGKFCNHNSKKLGKVNGVYNPTTERKIKNLIIEAAARPNNFNKSQITRAVNMVLKAHNLEPVSYHTIYNVLRSGEAQAISTAGSRGIREFNVKHTMHVKRKKPTSPMLFVSVDGWTAELLYQDNGNYMNRLVVVMVMDPFNNYPLGYAVGDRENIDLIKEANRNALLHSRELFGDLYTPWQLQSDNYGIKALRPFYEAMSKHFIPAAVGNAKAKPVEPYFSYLNKEYCQYMPNWSGFNVTARRENQPNAEWLDKNKKNIPSRLEVIRQIDNIISIERSRKHSDYVNAFMAAGAAHKLILSTENYYYLLGESTPPNRVHAMGITPKIQGEKLYFDTFDNRLRDLAHVRFTLHYDPADTSQALAVSECGQHRILVQEKYQQPMALADRKEGDAKELQRIREFNKRRKDLLTQRRLEAMNDARELTNGHTLALDPHQEASLKLMFTYNGQQKEALQDAKKLGAAKPEIPEEITNQAREEKEDQERKKSIQELHEEYINSKVDFNQYLD